MKGVIKNGLYTLIGKTVIGEVSSILEKGEDRVILWHKRLGHVSHKGLLELHKQGLLGEKKLKNLPFCEDCILGKAKRVSFKTATHTTKQTLDYVHSDLWGPARVNSHGGGSYFLSIIDDYSRKVWLYILKNKSDTFEKFKEWKKLVETQVGRKVKKLKTNNGFEYLSSEFSQLCKEEGMARHKTIRETPHQNGLAEIMNRTILERVRCS